MEKTAAVAVHIEGVPAAGVEVALIAADGDVLAAATSDAAGRAALEAPPAFAGGWVMAKLHDPVVGVVVAKVASTDTSVTLSAPTRDAVTLDAQIHLPDGAAADWFEVHATPRGLAGVPPEIVRAATLDGTGPSRRGTYHTVRITEPHARLRLLPGTWDLSVEHTIERPTMFPPAPPNWRSGVLILPDGRRVPEQLGAHRVEVTADLAVTVQMQPSSD